MGYNCFIAVSTREQMSNIPPLLFRAEDGDVAIWLESSESIEKKWLQGVPDILEDRGIRSIKVAIGQDINDPTAILNACTQGLKKLEALQGQCEQMNIILNGGTKLCSIAIVQVVQKLKTDNTLNMPVDYLYGDGAPVCVRMQQGDRFSSSQIYTYNEQSQISFDEMIRMKGYRTQCHDAQVWRWGDKAKTMPKYGTDEPYTRWLHYAWGRNRNKESGDITPLTDWPKRVQEKWNSKQVDDEPWWNNEKQSWRIGACFEDVVWRRVICFLQSQKDRFESVVQECWKNVKIVGEGNRSFSEMDVVLVLRNGIVIYIECKTQTHSIGELNASSDRLRQCSGNLSKMCVVSPMFASFENNEGGGTMKAMFQSLQSWSKQKYSVAIPYSLHPAPSEDNKEGDFESSMERLLSQYALKRG